MVHGEGRLKETRVACACYSRLSTPNRLQSRDAYHDTSSTAGPACADPSRTSINSQPTPQELATHATTLQHPPSLPAFRCGTVKCPLPYPLPPIALLSLSTGAVTAVTEREGRHTGVRFMLFLVERKAEAPSAVSTVYRYCSCQI